METSFRFQAEGGLTLNPRVPTPTSSSKDPRRHAPPPSQCSPRRKRPRVAKNAASRVFKDEVTSAFCSPTSSHALRRYSYEYSHSSLNENARELLWIFRTDADCQPSMTAEDGDEIHQLLSDDTKEIEASHNGSRQANYSSKYEALKQKHSKSHYATRSKGSVVANHDEGGRDDTAADNSFQSSKTPKPGALRILEDYLNPPRPPTIPSCQSALIRKPKRLLLDTKEVSRSRTVTPEFDVEAALIGSAGATESDEKIEDITDATFFGETKMDDSKAATRKRLLEQLIDLKEKVETLEMELDALD